MRQNAMTLLKNALKNGICPLIPLPVPRAWESGTHRKSTDVQRGDEPGRCPVSLLLQSTSSASCYVWDDRPKRLSKMVKAFLPQPTTSPSPCPPPGEREYKRWGGTACTYSGWRSSRSLVGGKDLEQSHNGYCHKPSCLPVILRTNRNNNWPPTLWPHTASTNKAFITTGHDSGPLVSHTLGRHILCLFNCKSASGLSGCTWETQGCIVALRHVSGLPDVVFSVADSGCQESLFPLNSLFSRRRCCSVDTNKTSFLIWMETTWTAEDACQSTAWKTVDMKLITKKKIENIRWKSACGSFNLPFWWICCLWQVTLA